MKSNLLSFIKSRLMPSGREKRHVRFGLYRGVYLNTDLQNQTQLYLGLWERETYAAIRKALRRASFGIDVGAGSGELTILMAKSGLKRVYAFEPSTAEFAMFKANVLLNDILSECGIDMNQAEVGTKVGQFRLDDLKIPFAGRGFLKIDVDGGELDVLKSGIDVLSNYPMDVLVETHSLPLEIQCAQLLSGKSYKTRIIRNGWYRALIPEQRPLDHNRWLFAER